MVHASLSVGDIIVALSVTKLLDNNYNIFGTNVILVRINLIVILKTVFKF